MPAQLRVPTAGHIEKAAVGPQDSHLRLLERIPLAFAYGRPLKARFPGFIRQPTRKKLDALMGMARRRRAYYAKKKKLGAIHEQRRRASERAAEKAAKTQEGLDAEMRKNWDLVLGTKVDSKEEVEATVTLLLQESQKNKQIKEREDKGIRFLRKQIEL